MDSDTATDTEQFERTPPQDVAAEQSALGAMLLSNHAIGEIATILTARDFYRPNHATIYNTILDLYTRGEPADSVTVVAALNDKGDLPRIGGAAYIHTLIESVPTAANGTYYAGIVRERAQDRRLIEAGTAIVQLGYRPTRDPDNPKTGQATKALYDAITERATDTLVPLGQDLNATLDRIHAGPERGLSTGFPDLDDLTGGLLPAQLWYVGARPSMGKSTAVIDFARAVAIKQHKRVLIFSLEMSRHQILTRILSAESGVALRKLKAGGNHLTDNDWSAIARASSRIDEAQILVDETPGLTIVDILARARREAARNPLGLVVIDHVHIMGTTGGKANESREREIARTSSGLKVMTKDLWCPVVAAAQLNRGNEMRTDKRPQMSDMRDSGSLEQDADVVILLYRDDYYDKESHRAGEADFIVAKNRDGDTDTITVSAQLHYSRFTSLATA